VATDTLLLPSHTTQLVGKDGLQWLDIWNRSHAHNSMWINCRVAHHVVMFNMHEVGSLLESGNLVIQMFHPCIELGIIMSDCPDIALEMLYVDWIEADYGDIQTNICFCEVISKEIFPR